MLRTFLRASSRRSARSHARSTVFHAASVRGWPEVVVAVTSTLMMTAGGRTPCRSALVGSWAEHQHSLALHAEREKRGAHLVVREHADRADVHVGVRDELLELGELWGIMISDELE